MATTNVTFHVGDATNLPFEDDSFDAANTHAVLMHAPDTEKTLSEVMRVLKPGGVLASREMITQASFVGPGRRSQIRGVGDVWQSDSGAGWSSEYG